ncbi:CIC11C00000004025 [Sungouiella intermedia]|uniref:CIC11C00000004025 n=1 Tax=Sungouiella intermedia TaxID=45354 RepID=A0A1L0FX06_9ASCO|nr:CIC11C00000004025 [[Candida] intermedia]
MESGRRHEIGNKIVALGGTHYTDLMSSVQYLVVGKRNTEKYRYSIRYRHDMVFLTEEAVTEIHSRWVAGHDYGLDLDTFRLPVFLNFTVCVARVEKPSSQELVKLFGEKFRNPPSGKFQLEPKNAFKADEIIRVMSMLGAKVSTTLTPTCDVLVGTDTAGRRYTMANEWKIPAVHPLWVFDSCLRGAALDLDDYVVNCEVGNLYNNGSSHTAQIIRDSTWDDPGSEDEKGSQANGTKNNKVSRETAQSEYDTGTLESLLFLGFKFLPVGYLIPQQKVLKKVVESHHGEIADSGDDDTITHILLLVKNGPQANLMLSALSSGTKRRVHSKDIQVVTDWFIERSIYYNEARQDNWSKPLQGLVPLATRYKVCVSGFTGVELLHIEKLVGYLNLEFCEVLNSNRDLLIINVNLFKKAFLKNSPELFEYKHKDILNCPVYSNGEASRSVATLSSKNKINAAKKWNIPIVSIAYLWEMIERLTGKSHLQMPDILDLAWCILLLKPWHGPLHFWISFGK